MGHSRGQFTQLRQAGCMRQLFLGRNQVGDILNTRRVCCLRSLYGAELQRVGFGFVRIDCCQFGLGKVVGCA